MRISMPEGFRKICVIFKSAFIQEILEDFRILAFFEGWFLNHTLSCGFIFLGFIFWAWAFVA